MQKKLMHSWTTYTCKYSTASLSYTGLPCSHAQKIKSKGKAGNAWAETSRYVDIAGRPGLKQCLMMFQPRPLFFNARERGRSGTEVTAQPPLNMVLHHLSLSLTLDFLRDMIG